jgi:hypothetical protein
MGATKVGDNIKVVGADMNHLLEFRARGWPSFVRGARRRG